MLNIAETKRFRVRVKYLAYRKVSTARRLVTSKIMSPDYDVILVTVSQSPVIALGN